jgi:hypothetical protein
MRRTIINSAAIVHAGYFYWRVARRERAYSRRVKLTGSRGHVTVNAQNWPKLGRLLKSRPLYIWHHRIFHISLLPPPPRSFFTSILTTVHIIGARFSRQSAESTIVTEITGRACPIAYRSHATLRNFHIL